MIKNSYAVVLSFLIFLFSTINASSLESIHTALFDLYLPSHDFLTPTDEIERQQWRTILTSNVINNPAMRALLGSFNQLESWVPHDIQKEFPDIIQQGFVNASSEQQMAFLTTLRRFDDNEIRRITAQLRLFYIAHCYSCPLINKIAGITLNQPTLTPIKCEFPASKLIVVDNEIKHRDGPIDFLIIGSGPAGSLIAYELMRRYPRCNVVMLEAGSFIIPGSIITESAPQLMEQTNTRCNASGGLIIRNGWTVGGGTTVNLDLAFSPLLPSVKSHLQLWIEEHGVENSLFHDSDNDWQKVQDAYQWVTDMIGTRTVTPAEINTNNELLLKGAANAQCYDLNQNPLTATEPLHKLSAVTTFLLPALALNSDRNSFSLIPDVKVKRILFNDNDKGIKCASGVQIEFGKPLEHPSVIKDPCNLGMPAGACVSLYARHSILCAGTLGSTEILLRSDLNNPEIGKGIVVHPSMGLIGRFNTPIDAHEGLSCAVYAPAEDPAHDYFFESMGAEPAFIPFLHQGYGKDLLALLKDFRYLGGFGVMLIDSVNKDNCITIDPLTDKTVVHYTLNEKDKERMRTALKRAAHILFEQGAEEIFIPTCEPILESSSYTSLKHRENIEDTFNTLAFIENQNFISSAHMQGSNKVGSNSTTSVVSPHFRVWNTDTGIEIPNLHAVDSSVFPTSVGANPMQTIYTIAKLWVDNFLKKIVNT